MDEILSTPAVVEAVEAVSLRSPLDPPASFSWGTADERNVGLVRVTLDDGTAGWGETSVTFPLWSLEERAVTVAHLAPQVVGATLAGLDDVDTTTARLREATDRLKLLWSPVGISAAIGAIEMAMIDALTRRAGVSAWTHLGGSGGPRQMYAVGFTGGPEEVAERAVQRLEQGYAAVKLRVGFGLDRDVALVSTVRSAVGDDAEILLDVNMGWTRDEAAEAVPALADLRPGWLEEPLPHTDVEGLAELRRTAPMPIAAGENAYGARELTELLDAAAVDVLMPDLARCGGFLVGLDAARTAQQRGVRISPHHYASDIGFATNVALCAVLGEGLLIRDVSPWPIREELVAGAFDVSDGTAVPYAGAGLSPEPDIDVVERWRTATPQTGPATS